MPLPYDPTRRSGENRRFGLPNGSIAPANRSGGNRTRTPVPQTNPMASPDDYRLPDWGYTGPISAPDTRNHPYYDPSATYASPGGGYSNLGGQRGMPGATTYNNLGTSNPEGYYYGELARRGLSGFDARSLTAQAMYRDYARGFQSARMNNMELTFPEYFGMQSNIENILNSFSDEQLGIDRQRYSGGGGYNWALRG